MNEELKITKMGKLRIYMATGESVKSKTLLRKIFPKSKYLKIMQEAKASGIMNAHVFHTHAAVQKGGKMAHHSVEGDNSGLTVCVELVDVKEKLQQFFKTHKDILKENTVIYKEVEFWEYKE
jgi:PII-like signaling protein